MYQAFIGYIGMLLLMTLKCFEMLGSSVGGGGEGMFAMNGI